MEGHINICGELSDQFPITNGVKQACFLVPTLFGLLFTVVLQDATSGPTNEDSWWTSHPCEIESRKKSQGHHSIWATVCWWLCIGHPLTWNLQNITSHFASAAKDFGLTISLKKIEVLYQPAPGSCYVETTVLIDDTHLNPVTKLCYLGSIMSSLASLDLKVESGTRIASFAFGQLKDHIWSQNIRLSTKCKVYRAAVISAVLYRCEARCLYQRHLHQIDQLQQCQPCSLMKITWWD